jgi:hypothetical protein
MIHFSLATGKSTRKEGSNRNSPLSHEGISPAWNLRLGVLNNKVAGVVIILLLMASALSGVKRVKSALKPIFNARPLPTVFIKGRSRIAFDSLFFLLSLLAKDYAGQPLQLWY